MGFGATKTQRRATLCDYATIYGMVRKGRFGKLAFASRTGLQPKIAARTAALMWSVGLIHPVAWVLAGTRWVPLWGRGAGPAARHPTRGDIGPPRLRKTPNMIAFKLFVEAITDSPTTAADLAEETGLQQRTTLYALIRHCKAIGLLHVADWKITNGGGDHAAMYRIGSKPDAPKPVTDKAANSRTYGRNRRNRLRAAEFLRLTASTIAV